MAGSEPPLTGPPSRADRAAPQPVYTAHALGFIPLTSRARREAIRVATSRSLRWLILSCILANTVTLGLIDFSEVDPDTYEPILEVRVPPRPHLLHLSRVEGESSPITHSLCVGSEPSPITPSPCLSDRTLPVCGG